MPPVALMVAEYAVLAVPEGSVTLMVNAEDPAPTTIERAADFVCAGLLASVTVTVKLEVPLVVGVPAIAPAGDRVSPAGRLPAVIAQV